MDPEKLAEAAQPNTLAGYITKLPQPHHHGGDGSIETVREDEDEGHHIVIHTTYRIEVDGQVLQVPLVLHNNGQLHCHALPNYQFSSAVDMIKLLIDNFPDNFARQDARHTYPQERGSGQGDHNHHV